MTASGRRFVKQVISVECTVWNIADGRGSCATILAMKSFVFHLKFPITKKNERILFLAHFKTVEDLIGIKMEMWSHERTWCMS